MAQMDKILEALELAGEIWGKTTLGMKEEKLAYAHQLYRMEHFSLPQIAKIVRLNSRYIYEEFTPNNTKGGRFDPATLSTLARIRRSHLQGQKIPHQLISMGIKGGTSYSCLTALTKIPYSAYYEVSRAAVAEVEQEKLKDFTNQPKAREVAERRATVHGLRDKGLTQKEIAYATGIDQPMVSRILRGLR